VSERSIADILRAAVAAVDDAGVPDDLRPAAFSKAADLIAGTAPTAPAQRSPAGEQRTTSASGGAVELVTRKLGVGEDVLQNVCEIEGDEVRLHFNHRHLPSTSKPAMREISLVLAALRQGAGFDDYTPQSTLRAACDLYGVLDPNNFASAVTAMRGNLSFRGNGSSREVKVTPNGYNAASELVERWAGDPSP
jgi:hypothetical protein